MAFHLSCPITCNRICFCTLGFPGKLQGEKKRTEFLEGLVGVEEFLSDPWSVRVGGKATVQVPVPRILPAATTLIDGGDGVGGDAEELLSAQAKRAAMQRRAVAASLAAEDYARRFETGNLGDISGEAVRELGGEEQASSLIKVVCRICYSGEDEGSDRAMRMLPCKSCSKRYHRSCLKSWAEYRDLFYWSSWACPSCRICEVCRRTGDANKFMFCKRCDGPYHCYCQHPPHKNVSSGPFLCPKHTRCHSCGSTVSGSGLSTRWFLGYTCCDACGRLFMKGNYCPVCLKVYRDTEPTPMVCCDACERWVHCECDGISDEKYQQFQADGNLYYKCAACRGDCYQVRDINDAVQELWRRRDKADKDQIASLRAAAGFPSQEEIFSIYPYSEEEDNGPIMLKSDNAHYLKLSVKGLVDKATEDTKKNGKKSLKGLYSNKKFTKNKGYHVPLPGKMEEPCQNVEKILGAKSMENCLEVESVEDLKLLRTEGPEFVLSPSNKKEKTFISLPGIRNPKFDEDVVVSREDRAHKILKIRNTAKTASKSNTVKGTKLVIHLGARNKNQLNSPRYDASSSAREQDFPAASGSEDSDLKKFIGKKHSAEVLDGVSKPDAGKGVKLVREHRVKNPKYREWDSGLAKLENGRKDTEDLGSAVRNTTVVLGRTVEPVDEATVSNDEVALRKHSKGTSVTLQCERPDNLPSQPVSSSVLKDSKPLLKLKFKNPYLEKQNSWCLQGEEEKGFVKGQRSKRKRSSPLMEKTPVGKNESEVHLHRNNSEDEVMDAKWIVKKLGKDAIGKRVELHQSSDNSWHKGIIINMIEGTPILTVSLDDGQLESVELGKQGLRFISQKQKRMKQFSGLS